MKIKRLEAENFRNLKNIAVDFEDVNIISVSYTHLDVYKRQEVGKKLPGFPIVLHGASSVNQDLSLIHI